MMAVTRREIGNGRADKATAPVSLCGSRGTGLEFLSLLRWPDAVVSAMPVAVTTATGRATVGDASRARQQHPESSVRVAASCG